MIKSLQIEISNITNFITNGEFELWEELVPQGWTGHSGTGYIQFAETLYGTGVLLYVDEDSISVPRIEQVINSSELTSVNYTIGLWSKGDARVVVSRGTTEVINEFITSENWKYWEFDFTNYSGDDVTVSLEKARVSLIPYEYAYFDNVFVYDKNWYDDRKRLETSQILQFSNFIREIEDGLFEFKSDNINLIVRNHIPEREYFIPEDFETYSNSIFRFDINLVYYGESGDISKKIIMFSNKDSIKRRRTPTSDQFEIELYELCSLFKENNWFLGRVVQEDDEAFFKYNTYLTNPTIVSNNISLENVLTNLETDILWLAKKNFIPITTNGFTINNELTENTETISFHYDSTIGVGDEKYAILDIYCSSNGRLFLLMMLESRLNNNLNDDDVKVWEIINGSTLVKRDVPIIVWPPNAKISNTASISFIHTLNSTTSSDGTFYLFGIIQTMKPRFVRRVAYSDNTNTHSSINSEDITFLGELPWFIASYPERYKCSYLGSDGIHHIPNHYDISLDNMVYVESGDQFTNYDGVYEVSEQQTNDDTLAIKMYLYTKLTSSVYRFPRKYTFTYKDAYPTDILKDICISQDAIWYLEYSENTNNIVLTIKSRDIDGTPEEINESEILSEDSTNRIIKFNDIDNVLFRDDAIRLNYYIEYYDSVYGGGRSQKEIEMFGGRDYEIGDIVSSNGKTYFVKAYEFPTNKYKTYITLFERGT